MDVTLKYTDGREVLLTGCDVIYTIPAPEYAHSWSGESVLYRDSEAEFTVEVPMPSYHYSTTNNSLWANGDGNTIRVQGPTGYSDNWQISSAVRAYEKERREEMISKSTFNEALAEAGVAKNVRRKVEQLSSSDFEYLIAALLAKAFKPEMLKVFEEPVQKVKVVEEELPF